MTSEKALQVFAETLALNAGMLEKEHDTALFNADSRAGQLIRCAAKRLMKRGANQAATKAYRRYYAMRKAMRKDRA